MTDDPVVVDGSAPFGPYVERDGRPRLTYWASDVNNLLYRLAQERDTLRAENERAAAEWRVLSDAFEASVDECTNLKAENERLKAIEQAATKLLFDNGGPTGGDTYFGIPDEFVLAKIEDFQALEAAVKLEAQST